MKSIPVISILGLLLAAPAAAAEATHEQKIVPAERKTLTPEQHRYIVQAFVSVDSNFETFAVNFPSSQFHIYQHDPKTPRLTINTQLLFDGRYQVMLILEGLFEPDFSKLKEAHFVFFGAYDAGELENMKPKTVVGPVKFRPTEMAEFCDNPAKFQEAGKS